MNCLEQYIANNTLMKKVTNIHKGWNFDKAFINEAYEKSLDRIKLLYDYNYEILL